jgi:hypothetical protein
MPKVIDGTRIAPHGMFYLEDAGGIGSEPAGEVDIKADDHDPGCFALEEEKGEGWGGVGAMKPLVEEKRPTL